MYASSSSSRSLTSRPASQYFPELGESRQPIRFMSVDFPEPDGPMMATYSPLRISTSTPRRACTCSAPISYTLVSASVLMTTPELTRSSRYDSAADVSTGILLSPSLCLPLLALLIVWFLGRGIIHLDRGFRLQRAQGLIAPHNNFIIGLQTLGNFDVGDAADARL